MTPRPPPSQRAVVPQDHPARFPGFDVLAQVPVWDAATAGVVLERLSPTTQLAFFTSGEVAVARPLLDLLMGQDGEPRVPVLELIDTRLARGETDGWHYDDLPEDADAWRQTLAWLDADARSTLQRGFAHLVDAERAELIQAVQDQSQHGKRWHDYPAKQVWSLWTRYACTAFYSHPWAWNEMGFGGPAYPRGYLNLGIDRREHWEVADGGERG
ncbi:MAG: gluconate 2-dehydrogenase subunit 3 family protein [Jatrophihabitantaceae bacterium]